MSPAALTLLERYPWPGNVRELRNALEYAFVIGEGPVLTESDLPPEIASSEPGDDPVPTMVNAPPTGDVPPEVQRIRRALERADGNRARAAKILGLSRVTLWRRMRELGIEGT